MHHLADDGARADDGDLDDEVVEAVGAVAREGGHLRAALDLEHADGVGALEDCGRPWDLRGAGRGRRASP
jgi:hypothetical protein